MNVRQRQLLRWGEAVRRDLPWRRTRDPWAILVSELMLQQTQVSRVEPRYRAFMVRFPTVESCAASSPGDVVRMWEGLGYNRRALNLHRAAAEIVAVHGGRVPAGLDELLALPGIGPYTARAVRAFAFETDTGVLDTNAARVLARAFAGRRLTPLEAQALADEVVPEGEGWAWNQAVLDLGATVCVKTAPRCHHCPLEKRCAWVSAGRVEPDPAVGTAGISGPQSIFAGSDRQGRGRLVSALRARPVPLSEVAHHAGWPDDPLRAERVLEGLVTDGLARVDGGLVHLP